MTLIPVQSAIPLTEAVTTHLRGVSGSVIEARKNALQGRVDSFVATLPQNRRDSFSTAAPAVMARQLEHVYAEVLRETFPLNNALRLFPITSEVPAGARTHTIRRVYRHGEAAVYREGMEIPRVGWSQQEETFPVKYYVTSFLTNMFDSMSLDMVNISDVAEKLRIARDIINEFANMMTWYGSDAHQLYGVVNYPWLPKYVVGTAFDGSAAADAVISALNAIVNFPHENSRATMSPNTIVCSPRVRNYLFTTPRSSSTDTSIARWWLANNARGITTIEEAHELQGVGPGGTDGILAYRRDRLGIQNVIPAGFNALPSQARGFDDATLCWMSHGGVIMRDVGNNVLAWVDATP